MKYSTHKLPSIKYTNNNSACKLPQNSNTKAHFCNRLPDNIKHCLTSSIPGSGQQVKSPISSHHMLSKHSHYLCLSDSALPVFPVMILSNCALSCLSWICVSSEGIVDCRLLSCLLFSSSVFSNCCCCFFLNDEYEIIMPFMTALPVSQRVDGDISGVINLQK